uniref:Sushi domain-containing protein n=1 Tax=Pelusios castaneus TaxID=367368 RepID=A0A8C8SJU2_9SAUR
MGLCRPGWGLRLSALLALALLPAEAQDGNCGAPPRFSFAELQETFQTQTDFPVGTKLTYSCRPGYMKIPGKSNTVTCKSDSTWSPVIDFCQVKSCGNPGHLQYGSINIPGLTFGSEITFSCDEGYRLVGIKSSRCVLHEQSLAWNPEMPVCDAIACLPPPEIKNGKHSGEPDTHYTYGSSVTYSCDTVGSGASPFSLAGEASIHCTSDPNKNGIWSGNAPECKVIKCKNVEIENGRKISGFGPSYIYRNVITFECNSGYHLVGNRMVTCEANNSWVPELPTCEKTTPSTCSMPMLPNGEVSPSKPHYISGDAVTLTCHANYEFSNNARSKTVVCSGDDVWSPSVETCQLIPSTCSMPRLPDGEVSPSKPRYVSGDTVTLTCNANYVFSDNARSKSVVCSGDDVWSPPVETCQPVKQESFEELEIKHGKIILGEKLKYSVGDMVTIECNSGYTMHGVPKIQYMGKNRWQPEVPKCQLSVYIIVIICVLVIAAVGVPVGFFIHKKHISQAGKGGPTSGSVQYDSCKA